MRNLPVLSGTLLFVFAQMSSPGVNAHHSAHFSKTSSVDVFSAVKPLTMVADTLRFCTDLGNAELPNSNQIFLGEGHPDASKCSAHIWTTQTITDACGGNVTYDVRLYLNDGIAFIQIVDPTAVPLDLNQQAVLTFDTRESSLSPDHEISLHGVPYTSGSCAPVNSHHRLLWTVVNDCGETTTYDYLIRVEDCEKPVPICVGLSSFVVSSLGNVTIWAKDLESGMSVDDCTGPENLLYSFSGSEYQPSRFFSCSEICVGAGNGSFSFLLEIWMADGGVNVNCNGEVEWAERNLDFCTTFIVFDDPNGNLETCDCFLNEGGRVRTPLGAGIGGVTVDLYSPMGVLVGQTITNHLGYYEFPFINPLLTYRFEPVKNDNHKNGVSTLDLVLLQKHLLNVMPFDNPFEYIAADANNSESASALDLVEIRKLILGLYTEFPKSESWRFVPEHYQFLNLSDPWPFPGDTITSTHDGYPNFIGVKVGDIHSANNLTTIEVRNAPEILSLFIEDLPVAFNQVLEIPVYTDDVSSLLGLQLTMSTHDLVYLGVEPELMNISENCIATHDDAITMSWANLSPVTSDMQQPLFTLRFTAKADGRLYNMIDLNSSITKSEAYREITNAGEEEIEVMDVQLQFSRQSTLSRSTGYSLYQNSPNPVTDQTVIGIKLPEMMPVVLSIYNVHGQLISLTSRTYQRGYQEIPINSNDLGGNGTYFYRLDAGSFSETKRLVLLQK